MILSLFFVVDWDNTPIRVVAGGSHLGNCAATAGSPHAVSCLGHAALRFSLERLQWVVGERIRGILVYSPYFERFLYLF